MEEFSERLNKKISQLNFISNELEARFQVIFYRETLSVEIQILSLQPAKVSLLGIGSEILSPILQNKKAC
ncbi:hypothetical protein [Leptospira stimsonii]|uniref:Uncharacterized protein n=1 Tax=Leptospira stimsonii TaxID=2202203 RepID=A0A396ZAF0_9LEPT|nr:hypothetical protein [Leptospira stimsonii]RHX92271.1 hypothetical protein DLM75_03445 [Leptospira stimsonii]